MKKKSGEFSRSKAILRDIPNSITAGTFMIFAVFFVMMFINTFGGTVTEIINGQEAKVFELTASIARNKNTVNFFEFAVTEYDSIISLIPFALGICQFAFLTNKSHCHNVLSMPLSRKTVFNNRFILPIALVLVTTIVIKLATLFIHLDIKGFNTNLLGAFIHNLINCLQTQLISYVIGVCACILCTRISEAVIFGIAVPFSPMLIIGVLSIILEATLRGNNSELENVFSEFWLKNGPFAFESGSKLHTEHYTEWREWYVILFWVAVTVAMIFVIKNYFVKYYKPENSGMKAANTITYMFTCLCAGCVLIYVAIMYYFVYLLGADDFYPGGKYTAIIVIGSILIGIVGAVVVGYPLSFSMKKEKLALFSGLGLAGVIAVTSIIGATGVFGIYNILPKKEKIERVFVTFPSTYTIDEYASSRILDFGMNEKSDQIAFSRDVDIETVLEIHKILLKNKKAGSTDEITIDYCLSDGKSISRNYKYVSRESILKLIDLWDTPEVKETFRKKLTSASGDFENAFISVYSKKGVVTNITPYLTEEIFNEIKTAYYEDIKTFTADDWFNGTSEYLGYMTVLVNRNEMHWQDDPDNRGAIDNVVEVYAPDSYKIVIKENAEKTIAVLKKYDLYKFFVAEKEIEYAYICDFEVVEEYCRYSIFEGKNVEIFPPVFFADYKTYVMTDSKYNPKAEKITDVDEIENLLTEAQCHCIYNEGDKILVVFYDIEGDEMSIDQVPSAYLLKQ